MCGDNQPMKVKNLSYKVEFQGRGAGHIHGVLWVDLAKLEKDSLNKNEPNENSKSGKTDEMSKKNYLTSAFDKLRLSKPLSKEEISALVTYVDKFITCSLNPAKLSQMALDGKKLAELAKSVQEHSHTRTCHKYDNSCRFHKPSLPMKETRIFQKETENKNGIESNEDVQLSHKMIIERMEKIIKKARNGEKENPDLLRKVKELLDDKDIVDSIMEKYNKDEETVEEYKKNKNARIDKLLEIAGTTYDEYIKAIQASVKAGLVILLERDIDEGYINAFNPEWLEAWEGNLDL